MDNVVSLAERFPGRFVQPVEETVMPEQPAAPTTAEPTLAEQLGVKVGDFFYSSWGYDQTNVDFYKVVGITPSGKSVRVQLWSQTVASSNVHDSVIPGKTAYSKKVLTKRLRGYSGRASFSLTSYSNGYHWDGAPKHQTGHGMGH